jgi:hypothetical protein
MTVLARASSNLPDFPTCTPHPLGWMQQTLVSSCKSAGCHRRRRSPSEREFERCQGWTRFLEPSPLRHIPPDILCIPFQFVRSSRSLNRRPLRMLLISHVYFPPVDVSPDIIVKHLLVKRVPCLRGHGLRMGETSGHNLGNA